jgi:hypothetical protein
MWQAAHHRSDQAVRYNAEPSKPRQPSHRSICRSQRRGLPGPCLRLRPAEKLSIPARLEAGRKLTGPERS